MTPTHYLLPDDEPEMDKEVFMDRLRSDAAFVAKMRAHHEPILALPDNEETLPMKAMATDVLLLIRHQQGRASGEKLLVELQQVLAGLTSYDDPEDLRKMLLLLDEARDCILDAMEPQRTTLMKIAEELHVMLHRLYSME